MTRICFSNHTTRSLFAVFAGILSLTAASRLDADDASEPAWRSGVSRWNGSGYDFPVSNDATPPATSQSTELTLDNPLPYTVPSGPEDVVRENPYLGFPDDRSELKLTDPSVSASAGDVTDAATPSLELPANAAAVSSQSSQESAMPTGKSDGAQASVSELPSPVQEASREKQVSSPSDASGKSDATAQAETKSVAASATPEANTIGSKMDQTVGEVETAPLQEEVIRWYQYPVRWMRGWNSHAEFGLDGSDGNADTLALQTGLEMKRQSELHTLAIDVDYRQASNRQRTVEDNGRFNVDYDRLLKDTQWAGFGKFGLEWDKFKAFDLRVNLNGGLAYHWIRRDDAAFVTRFGAGASQEIGAPNDDWIAEAVFGLEAERQLTARQKLKGKVDYFPAWEDFGNYRLVSDLAWEILLDGSENLSLKLAATDRYDSTPQGAKPNDIYYSLLLLYKF